MSDNLEQCDDLDDFGDEVGLSKTKIKQHMLFLQKIGDHLSNLKKDKLIKAPVEEKVLDALLFAQTIKSHGAKKRHRQYIGKLLRYLSADEIQAILDFLILIDKKYIKLVNK